MTPLDELKDRAQALLRANDRGGTTIPSPALYPHQWNWDSAFCAIGWATFDADRGLRELELLLASAWPSGMVPHVIFDPAAEGYEPSPRWWRTAEVFTTRGRPTSSLTQPPVAATALRRLLELAERQDAAELEALRERARSLLAPLAAWHRWFGSARSSEALAAPAIVHPWESGLDNSPRWDAALARVAEDTTFERRDNRHRPADERPIAEHYRRYAHLVQLRADQGFAPPREADWPFLVVDVVLAAILLRAERDLAALGELLGRPQAEALTRAERLERAILDALYDPASGRFHDHDRLVDRPVDVAALSAYLPLYAGLGGDVTADALEAAMADPDWLGSRFGLPTMELTSPSFEPRRYWRGPCWINTNWMLIRGLEQLGRAALAERIRGMTLELLERSGFREYYDPRTGEGLGGEDFAWSAALLLDLAAD